MSLMPRKFARRIGFVVGAFPRFRRETRGLAAIEFALILPVLLLFYGSLVEFSRGLDESRKLDHLGSTIADVISQQPTGQPVASSTVAYILAAAPPLMAPFGSSGLAATVSVVQLARRLDGTCCDATIKWSFTQNGKLRPCSTILQQVGTNTPALPANILASVVANTAASNPGQLVVADVQDGFQPLFGFVSLFSSGFSRTVYMPVRVSGGQLVLQYPAAPQQGQQAQICP